VIGAEDSRCIPYLLLNVKSLDEFIDKNGKVRITDFGIAIMIGEKRLTAPNIGSWLYISPEQIKRPKEPDIRSDVYSAGIVLYEMLTGHVPFDGDTPFEIQDKHINSPVPDPIKKNPQISKPISQIILRALSKNPDNRFNGCREFLKSIETYEIKNKDNSSIDKIVAFIGQILLIIVALALVVILISVL